MNVQTRVFGWFYTQILRLYPKEFRVNFGDEMSAVFMQAVAENDGTGKALGFFLREFRDLPLSLAREHWYSLIKKEIPMTTIYRKPEWFFYPGWVALTTLSIPVAFAITWIIVSQVTNVVGGRVMINGRSRITEDWLAGYVFVPALGLATGLLQYLLLRRYLPRMGWWVGATALGWPSAAVIGYFLVTFLPESLDTNANWFVLLMISLVGGFVSFVQWLVLRRRVPRAGWWIPATIVGWMAARLAAGEALVGPLDIWHLGVLPAVATGFAWWLLLKQRPRSPGARWET